MVSKQEFNQVLNEYISSIGKEAFDSEIDEFVNRMLNMSNMLKNNGLNQSADVVLRGSAMVVQFKNNMYDTLFQLDNFYQYIKLPQGYYVDMYYQKYKEYLGYTCDYLLTQFGSVASYQINSLFNKEKFLNGAGYNIGRERDFKGNKILILKSNIKEIQNTIDSQIEHMENLQKMNFEKIRSLENFHNKADGILISHEIRILLIYFFPKIFIFPVLCFFESIKLTINPICKRVKISLSKTPNRKAYHRYKNQNSTITHTHLVFILTFQLGSYP